MNEDELTSLDDQASEDFLNDMIAAAESDDGDTGLVSGNFIENDEVRIDRADTITHTTRGKKVSFIGALPDMFKNMLNIDGYASRSQFMFGCFWFVALSAVMVVVHYVLRSIMPLVSWALLLLDFLVFALPYLSLVSRRFKTVGLCDNRVISVVIQELGALALILSISVMLVFNEGMLDKTLIPANGMVALKAIIAILLMVIIILTASFGYSKEDAYKGKTTQTIFYVSLSILFGVLSIGYCVLTLVPTLIF